MLLDVQFSCQYVFLNSLLKYYIIIPNIITNPAVQFQPNQKSSFQMLVNITIFLSVSEIYIHSFSERHSGVVQYQVTWVGNFCSQSWKTPFPSRFWTWIPSLKYFTEFEHQCELADKLAHVHKVKMQGYSKYTQLNSAGEKKRFLCELIPFQKSLHCFTQISKLLHFLRHSPLVR